MERRGAAIEVADLVVALAGSRAGRSGLAAAGLAPDKAMARAGAEAAAHARHDAIHAAGGETPPFSQDTLTVLERAEALARRRGADTVNVADVCEVLARGSGDLAGMRFLASASSHAPAPVGHRSSESRRRSRARGGAAGHATAYNRLADTARHDDRVSATPSDPFQLRLNPEDLVGEASLRSPRERDYRHDEASPQKRAHPEHGGCDTRALERQLSDLATQNAEHSRLAHGHRERSEARLNDLARDVAALQLAMREALDALGNRLATRAAEDTSTSGNGRNTDRRLATIEAALQRLEALVARQGGGGSSSGARSSSSSSSSRRSGTSRGLRSLSRRRRPRSSRSSSGHREFNRGHSDRSTGRDQHERADRTEAASNVMAFEAAHDEGDPAAKRFYLSMSDEIVCAPSIGPRTGVRLNAHGIDTVADLLAADPGELAELMASRHITTQTIEDWQMQSRLVCTIPWLRGTHAQLLVGAGYTSARDIADAGGDELSADILKFASTREGQRALRNGPPPPIERVAKWAEFATLAEVDRAA
jgi:predicted flap endonuclease-1-like 5' DNA nuclease